MVDYNKRLVEVDVILNHLPHEELLKIPEHIRKLIKENKDEDYLWTFDEKKHLKDQNLSNDTLSILAYLNTEYLLNEEQKKVMEQIYALNEKKEEKKAEKYNSNDLFKNNDKKVESITQKSGPIQENMLIEYKENIFKRIVNKIKELFKR